MLKVYDSSLLFSSVQETKKTVGNLQLNMASFINTQKRVTNSWELLGLPNGEYIKSTEFILLEKIWVNVHTRFSIHVLLVKKFLEIGVSLLFFRECYFQKFIFLSCFKQQESLHKNDTGL